MELKVLQSKKKLFIIIGLIIISSFSFYLLYLNNSQLLLSIKNKVVTQLEEEFNINIEVKEVNLAGFNKIRLEQVKVKSLNQSINLLQADKVVIGYSWKDFLFNSLKPLHSIKKVNITAPVINLTKAEGEWNYHFLQSRFDLGTGSLPSSLAFSIELREGNINLDSPQFKKQVDNVSGEIKIAEKIEASLEGKMSGISSRRIKFSGELEGDKYSTWVNFTELNIEELNKEFNLIPPELLVKGNLAGRVKAAGRLEEEPTYYGDLTLEKAAVEYSGIRIADIEAGLGVNNYGIKIREASASYEGMPFTLAGEIFGWEEPQLNLDYYTSSLELKKLTKVLPSNLQLAGIIEGEGEIKGELKNPSITGKVSLEEGEVNNFSIKDLSSRLHYKEGILNLKQLDFSYKEGQFRGSGTINFEKPFNYMLSVKFEELALKELDSRLEYSGLSLTGRARGEGIISGQSLSGEEVNILGSLSVYKGEISGYSFEEIKSNFWLNEGKLFLNQAQLATAQGGWDLEGIISLTGDLDLTVEADQVNLAKLKEIHSLNKLQGLADLKGNIGGNFSQPEFEGEFSLADLAFDKFNLTKAQGRVSYRDKIINLQEVKIPEVNTESSGKIDFNREESQLVFAVDGVQAEKLMSISGVDLDLTGEVKGDIQVNDILGQPQVTGSIAVKEGRSYGQFFDWTELYFTYQDEEFRIDDIEVNYKGSTLRAQGKVTEEGLDLGFTGEEVDLQHINLPPRFESVEVEGKAKVEGRVYGEFSDLEVGARIESEDLQLAQYDSGKVSAKIHYNKPKLHVKNGRLEKNGSIYKFKGGVDLYQQQFNNFVVDVLEGKLADLNQFIEAGEIDLAHEIQGRAEINGSFNQPRVSLDLEAVDVDEEGKLKVVGNYWAKNGLNLQVRAYQFALNPFNELDILQDFDLLASKLAGNLNLTGRVTGALKQLNLNSNLKITDGQIGNLKFEELTGPVRIIEGEKVFLQQRLQVKGRNVVKVDGLVPFTKDDKFDLNIKLEEGNLSLLSLGIDELKSAQGRGTANIELTGTKENLEVKGNAQVIEGSLDHPLFDSKIKRLSGELDFTGNKIKVNNLTGTYGKGEFEVAGDISLKGYMPDNFDLTFTGKDIIFEHGSWRGENDVDLKIQGDVKSPLIKGSILAQDTMFSLPVKWPIKKGATAFTPRFDLAIKPEKNVKVGNENIDILVQEGTLNVITNEEDRIELTGSLKSTNGRFTYYNTEFEVVEADARFNKYTYMPTLNIRARTLVEGTEIYLDLVGPTENSPSGSWEVSFSSNPSLPRREIINLLTRQGGIGNLLEKDYEQAVRNELWRVIGQGIKTELIYKVERSFERSLNIDQFRIKSLLAEDELVEIRVGKFIFDGFMLKYNRTFGMDIRQSLGFEYSFTEGLDNLKLSGNYEISEKEEDFDLGMEITIPF